MKYKHDIAGKNGQRVSSVWLAAGKAQDEYRYYAENSEWYNCDENRSKLGARSGIFALNPKVSCLDEVFEEIFSRTADAI